MLINDNSEVVVVDKTDDIETIFVIKSKLK